MTFIPGTIEYKDSPNLDAFGRLRVGVPHVEFTSKQLYDGDVHSFETATSGGSSSVAYRTLESSSRLTAGTGATDYAVRQTKKHFVYVPGNSLRIEATFVMIAAPTANCSKLVGYFQGDDGIFLEWTSTAINAVLRTSTSGSPVDETVAQANWNVDKLDGTGKSGVTIDLTKLQILFIDMQWLGGGRARFGFNVNGRLITAHEFKSANVKTLVYMKTPNLPVRWEVVNSAGTSGDNSMDAVCCSVVTEGGEVLTGHGYSVGSGATKVSVGTSRTPILAVRQALTFNSKVNRRIAFIDSFEFFVEDQICYIEAVQFPIPSITGTWVDLDANHSGIQYMKSPTVGAATEHRFWNGYGFGSNKVSSSAASNVNIQTHHSEMLVNYAGADCETIVFFATSDVASANVRVAANCIEYY